MSNLTCHEGIFNNTSSGSLSLRLSNPYGGIPENLLWNAVGWVFLIVSFGLLRRLAGNYGRLGVLERRNNMASSTSNSPWTQLFYQGGGSRNNHNDSAGSSSDIILEEQRENYAPTDEIADSRGLFSWLTSIFTLSEEKFLNKCGPDAVQYLSFQRYLIQLTFIMTAACLIIILPINFQGNLQGSGQDFGHTTISNLEGNDSRLWTHVILAMLFLPLGTILMVRFSSTLRKSNDCISSRTIMLAKVPRSFCTEVKITSYFNSLSTDFEIEDICIAHDVSKLMKVQSQWKRARLARLYCEMHDEDLTLRLHDYAHCKFACCAQNVNAYNYYSEQERKYYDEILRIEAMVKNGSIGVAFLTFKTSQGAENVLKSLNKQWGSICKSFTPNNSTTSRLEKELKPWKWTFRLAPPPDDIYWENLDYDSHRMFIAKVILVNLALFTLLFFFTSPAYILSQLQLFLNTVFNVGDWNLLPQKINDFVPTLFLWTLSALLPNIVAYSDWLMGHWRRSVENIWIMRKTFFYLLFMVLILPSIGLTSLLAFAELVFNHNDDKKVDPRLKWSCIFLPDNGAFFVNYVITSSLVGTGLELIRFSELFLYAIRMVLAKSVAEIASVRSANLYEFPFGYNYGWMLLIFALTSAYAVVCPLITPFGLFYMIMKHGVDRYNLYYAYKPSKINKNIHFLAVNCVIVSLLIQQVILLFFNIIRSGQAGGSPIVWSPRAIFSIVVVSICSLLFALNILVHICEPLLGVFFKSEEITPDSDDEGLSNVRGVSMKYMPECLLDQRPPPPRSERKFDKDSEESSSSAPMNNYGTLNS